MNNIPSHRFVVVASFALALACCVGLRTHAAEVEFKQLNLGDRVVTNAYIASATPVEVVVMWDGGGKTFKRDELPPALKERYPFNAAKAAAFLKAQEADREKRLQQEKLKQQRANQDLKATLLGQRQSLKQRIAELEKELAKVHGQIDNRRPRMRRRLSPAEHAEQERLTRRQGELRDQIDDLHAKIAAIDLRLSGIP